MSDILPPFAYNGARSLVLLHEKHLLSFVDTWKEAYRHKITLPETSDPDYESLEHLLLHPVRSARNYMTWICEKLELPDPGIDLPPELTEIVIRVDAYAAHVLERWRLPLVGVPAARFEDKTYESRWGVHFCIDAMLEHAVMHPIRHEFQLKTLMAIQVKS